MEIESHKPKILMIEDNDLLSGSLYHVLKKEFDVTVANDGNSAMALLYYNNYDAIFCDILLPDKSGKDIYDYIKQIKPHLLTRLIFTSGGPVQGLEFIADTHWLPKPFSTDQLKAYLKNVIYS